jgi:hypothetical protein
VNNNPQWLNDMLRTGDKIIEEGKARDRALAREARLNDTRPVRQQIVEGMQSLVALAVAIVGLFVGGMNFGWIGAIVLGAVGFVGTIFLFGILGDRMSGMAENRLWKQRPQDRTRDDLKQYWQSKFGSPISEELLKEVDLDGAAWVIDKKANFILRLKSGGRLYVGHPDGATLRVEKRGGGGIDARDAMLMMLARKSAGAEAAQPTGDDKTRARLWAAAQIVGLDVVGYEPDAMALEVHRQMQQQYKETRP